MRIKFSTLTLIAILLLMTSGLGCVEDAESLKDLTPREAFAIIQKNRDNPNFAMLDVRTPEEFAGGHIEKAVNLDFYNINFRKKLSELDKNKTYLVYCQAGVRSGEALEVMKKLGFKRIFHLPAGIEGWEEGGLPLER